jgi:hypothetical protein
MPFLSKRYDGVAD